jgi:transcriptional regulator with XRE-family HTH domain
MSLAKRIQEAREQAGMTLDELAKKAGISKTYLWELENDIKGEKKPSADVLLKLANALSSTIANLMGLPEVQVDHAKVALPSSLVAFRDWMKSIGEKVTDHDLRDLAMMRFRGGQPRTKEDWFDLYRLLRRTSEE